MPEQALENPLFLKQTKPELRRQVRSQAGAWERGGKLELRRQVLPKLSLGTRNKCVPKLELGNEEKALYMAALCSTLHNPLIKIYYKALRAKGKPAKVALTAVMRKLLLHLNSLLKTPTEKLS